MIKRILVCGGRDYNDADRLESVLDNCRGYWADDFILIVGGAKGADLLAECWAVKYGYACARVNANWNLYRKTAGPVRNEWMLRLCPDLVIAFPGGSGTKHMIQTAKRNGITVYEV